MHNMKLKRILAVCVLIFHDKFFGIIGNEPSGKYKDPIHHPFNKKIMFFLSDTIISMVRIHKWKNDVIEGFNKNYWLGINI